MSTAITEPGIYPDLDEDTYHSDPVPETSLSVSGAKKLLDCPARFIWEQENRTVKKAFDFGHAAHAKVLGRGLPVVAIPDDILATNGATSTTKAKEFVKAAREAGHVPLKSGDVAVIDAMAEKLATHPVAASLLREGEAEQSLFWRDDDTKVMLRARLDWLTRLRSGRPLIVDYKTTGRSAAPDRFAYEARDFGYHMQDPWYREGAHALGLEDAGFVFIVQEKEAPYLVSVCELDDAARDVGAQRNRVARATYLDCKTRDEWPGYAPVIHPLSLPYAKYAPEGDAA